jgi:predicted nucleic acid-binding Zn ribbon protein
MTADPLVVCPNCGKHALKRAMGTGGGIIFKGSGFYQTDYKKNGSSPSTTTEKKKVGTETKPAETKSTEPASGSKETKPAAPSKKKE